MSKGWKWIKSDLVPNWIRIDTQDRELVEESQHEATSNDTNESQEDNHIKEYTSVVDIKFHWLQSQSNLKEVQED